MKFSIVYSSRTGNTKLLAETIRDALPAGDCVYFGEPAPEALEADCVYAGFWTDKGRCDDAAAEFLKTLTTQKLFLFGTAGFGGTPAYFQQILQRTEEVLPASVQVIGRYMCQGKMPLSVRKRYESMQDSPEFGPRMAMLIENFDRALTHPDQRDLAALREQLPASAL